MNSIQLNQQLVKDSLPELIALVESGDCIPAHSDKYKFIRPNDIRKLPMKVLEKNLLNIIAENQKYNATQILKLNHKIDSGDTVVVKFFHFISEFKKCIQRESFTDAFEQAIKLKLFLAGRSEIDTFVGDAEMGLAMNAISLKFTSEFFDTLESMEKEHKKMLSERISGMLDS